jgi:hypothetical protein
MSSDPTEFLGHRQQRLVLAAMCVALASALPGLLVSGALLEWFASGHESAQEASL